MNEKDSQSLEQLALADWWLCRYLLIYQVQAFDELH